MNLDETTEELEARTRMAASLQRLGHDLVGHRVNPDVAHRVTEAADTLAAEVSACPERDRSAEMATSPRFARWLDGGGT